MANKRTILTIVGGGVWVGALLKQLVVTIQEQQLDIRLVARDLVRLEYVAEYCRRISTSRADWRIFAQTLDAAIDGADICVLLLRVGGYAARDLDEHFPRDFGQIGDEGLGLGGYANALRTIPAMAAIAQKLAVASPNVIAVNLVAPLGMTTRVLLDQGINAFGLCELPITTERALRNTFTSSSQPLCFTGLNHLGWFWSPNLDMGLFEKAVAARLVDEDVLRKFAAVPLKYYYKIYNPTAARLLGIAGNTGRAQELAEIAALTLDEIRSGHLRAASLDKRLMPWFDDALVPVLGALIDHGSWCGFANLRQTANHSWCEGDAVIEGRATLERSVMNLERAPKPTNASLLGFLTAAARAEACVYRAALGEDPTGNVRAALEEGPLELPPAQLYSITRAICDAGRQFRI
jgi:6-phospho-beta-glucosidase